MDKEKIYSYVGSAVRLVVAMVVGFIVLSDSVFIAAMKEINWSAFIEGVFGWGLSMMIVFFIISNFAAYVITLFYRENAFKELYDLKRYPQTLLLFFLLGVLTKVMFNTLFQILSMI